MQEKCSGISQLESICKEILTYP